MRAKRISLRVSNSGDGVSLTIPGTIPITQAIDFARQKEPWLRKALARTVPPVIPEIGGTLRFEGRDLVIARNSGGKVRVTGDRIEVPGRPAELGVRLRKFFEFSARARFGQASVQYAEILGRTIGRISIRDPKSRWGSCAATGNLMYSWRLILAPPVVLDYVAAHEVAHLAELNHSPEYWAIVAGLMPDFQTHRRWLRTNGASLHALRI